MTDTAHVAGVGTGELRERAVPNASKPGHAENTDDARETVMKLNEAEEKTGKDDAHRRTYGRTPDGTGTSKHHTDIRDRA